MKDRKNNKEKQKDINEKLIEKQNQEHNIKKESLGPNTKR